MLGAGPVGEMGGEPARHDIGGGREEEVRLPLPVDPERERENGKRRGHGRAGENVDLGLEKLGMRRPLRTAPRVAQRIEAEPEQRAKVNELLGRHDEGENAHLRGREIVGPK